jgi:DNA-binding LytR/AlgR family response regulator
VKRVRCLVVDDEELARTLLRTYIEKIDVLELVAAVENPIEASSILKMEQIDVVFLDIQMPELKGTDFAKMIDTSTKVIFTTAYSEYALEGFELNALDYLLKPITFERFLQSVNKIETRGEVTSEASTIIVKSGYDLHKLNFNDILYIESDSEYVVFHTFGKKIMSYQTLTSLEKLLPDQIFLRVHRSYIVNMKKVSALKGKDLLLSEIKIPVSATYYDVVKAKLF